MNIGPQPVAPRNTVSEVPRASGPSESSPSNSETSPSPDLTLQRPANAQPPAHVRVVEPQALSPVTDGHAGDLVLSPVGAANQGKLARLGHRVTGMVHEFATAVSRESRVMRAGARAARLEQALGDHLAKLVVKEGALPSDHRADYAKSDPDYQKWKSHYLKLVDGAVEASHDLGKLLNATVKSARTARAVWFEKTLSDAVGRLPLAEVQRLQADLMLLTWESATTVNFSGISREVTEILKRCTDLYMLSPEHRPDRSAQERAAWAAGDAWEGYNHQVHAFGFTSFRMREDSPDYAFSFMMYEYMDELKAMIAGKSDAAIRAHVPGLPPAPQFRRSPPPVSVTVETLANTLTPKQFIELADGSWPPRQLQRTFPGDHVYSNTMYDGLVRVARDARLSEVMKHLPTGDPAYDDRPLVIDTIRQYL